MSSNRSTISANDVLMALAELEFDDFEETLEVFLKEYKAKQATKKAKKEAAKKTATSKSSV
eukprot:CAMPEP_0177649184 /NCGR_PEP_ID=MMETSP0447-20121125/11234_1 /TAXON_ID=0 /ORGANISM="Stygamoeba regulata, Strain BSH-02190019" /LENGTH=60 /DNA_ID=CAMNT_0019151891 /DNA_START=620 /DNA_END=802 /DNA_ORIENTATION=-